MLLNLYNEWIDKHYPTLISCLSECHNATEKMKVAFPELLIVAGWVNGSEHYWCKDSLGNIVDPTVKQFRTDKLNYREFKPGDEVRVGRCCNCGDDIYRSVQTLEGNRVSICSTECADSYKRYIEKESKTYE